MAENASGSCTMCCKLLDIPDLDKPRGQWCAHCAVGAGCTIYETRPAACRDFACLWLESQGERNPLPVELRPDKAKLMLAFTDHRKAVLGHCDPARPDAWKDAAMLKLLQLLSRTGLKVMFGNGVEHFAMDRGRARPVELAPPDAEGVRVFVRFLD